MAPKVHWLTTAPNPRAPAAGYDAGQRGWRLHAVVADDSQAFKELGRGANVAPSACGLRPRHGWSLDLFIEDKCARCLRKVKE